MASTDIEICSNALIQLGDDPINSFNDGSGTQGNNRGRACANLYPTVRDKLLRSFPWNCAKKQSAPSKDSTAPQFDFTNQFLLPADWLRCIAINDRKAWSPAPFFKIQGRKILTDEATVKLTYIYKNTDVSSYDAELINCLELAMCARLAMAVTGKIGVRQEYENLFREAVIQAQNTDSMEESADYFEDNLVLEARESTLFNSQWPGFSQ